MSDIFNNEIVGWKQKRVHYLISKSEKEQKNKLFLKDIIKKEDIVLYERELPVSKVWNSIFNNKLRTIAIGKNGLSMLYVLTRKLKPEIILETGVQHGCSTSVFLYALHKNNKGKLISIDSCTEEPENVGILVPDNLKDRWQFIKGKTCDVLPTIKEDVDIFMHDSLHTYDNMYFEYGWAVKDVKEEGIILTHDIGTNNSFYDFCENYGLTVCYLKSSVQKSTSSADRFGIGATKNLNSKLKSKEKRVNRKNDEYEKKKEFKRNHFTEGLEVIQKLKNEIEGIEIKEKKDPDVRTELKNYYEIIFRGEVIANIAPRRYCLYGGRLKNKVFRVLEKEDEKQLFEEIEKQIEKVKKYKSILADFL